MLSTLFVRAPFRYQGSLAAGIILMALGLLKLTDQAALHLLALALGSLGFLLVAYEVLHGVLFKNRIPSRIGFINADTNRSLARLTCWVFGVIGLLGAVGLLALPFLWLYIS